MNFVDQTKTIAKFAGACLAAVITVAAVQVRAAVNYEPYTFTTLAGGGSAGSNDGTGSAAAFNFPIAVAMDSSNNVYVADYYNSTIRKITPDGVVTTVAGLAGSTGSDDGTGSAARFNHPAGVAVDSSGNLYVSDFSNNTIRKIAPGGVVTTFAGLAGTTGSDDGAGSAARFYDPAGLATDSSGNVYVAEQGNTTIRKITPGGVVTTLAGSAGNGGSADGTGSAASFFAPEGLATDSTGNVYVADAGNKTIRKITPGGVVTTLAGVAGNYGSDDGTGSAASFGFPSGVATDSSGNVYVADDGFSTIRKITPAGVVTTLAGVPGSNGSADGIGSAARFNGPFSVAMDSSGNVYVADSSNNAIRKGYPAVTCPPISLSTAPLPDAQAGSSYSQPLAASGGAAPYSFAVTSGSLPSGLNLSAEGTVSGTPTALGDFSFTVTASDTNYCTGSRNYSITVSCPVISLNPTLTNASLGMAYSQTLSASGGGAPYSFALTSGSLPANFALGADGSLAGLPLSLGTNTFTITATDTNGCTGSAAYVLVVGPSGNALDTNAPLLTISSPHNMSIISNSPAVTVSGTAKDTAGKVKTGVALVTYSFNGGAAQLVTTANKFTNWTANITVVPGWNTFTAQAFDFRGNASTVVSNVYYYGTPTNVTGAYQGFFCETNNGGAPAITLQSAGTVTMSLNINRIYSGKAYIDGASYPFRGTFDLAGNSSVTISRASSSKADLAVALHLDWTGASKAITGTVSCADEGWSSPLAAIWTFKAK